jgi:hypothetical protein
MSHMLSSEIYRRVFKNSFPITGDLQRVKNILMRERIRGEIMILKKKLSSASILAAPNLSEKFIVTTDASDYAIGAILLQGKIGQDKPCAYASRCLKESKLRYPTYDNELLAILFAKEQSHHYLY